MVGYGRIFTTIAGASGNFRNLFSNRNALLNVQQCATLKAKALEKLGVPPKPKRPLTPFFKFMKNERPKVVASNPGLSSQDVLKKIAQNWSNCDPNEKDLLQKSYEVELLAYSKQVMIYEQSITPEQKKLIKEAKEKVHDKVEKDKLKKKITELGKPKKPPTSFIQYMQERKVMRNEDEKVTEWVRHVADAWRKMSLEEKTKYQVESQKLMDQYRRDIRDWEEKMVRMGHIDVVRNRGLIDLKTAKAE